VTARTWDEVRALALAENGAAWPCLYPLRKSPAVPRPPWPTTPALSPAEARAMATYDRRVSVWEAREALAEALALAEERLAVIRKVEGWEDTRAGLIVRADALVAALDALRPVGS
jgi:hypothetical protein